MATRPDLKASLRVSLSTFMLGIRVPPCIRPVIRPTIVESPVSTMKEERDFSNRSTTSFTFSLAFFILLMIVSQRKRSKKAPAPMLHTTLATMPQAMSREYFLPLKTEKRIWAPVGQRREQLH